MKPPLLFLHGWGLNGQIWKDIVPALAGERTCLCPELPGYDGLPPPQPYHPETLADRLISQVDAPSSIVCGWSMGGMVAQALAVRHPGRVRALVLVGTTPAFVNRADWAHGLGTDVVSGFADDLTRDYSATVRRFLGLQALGGASARSVIGHLMASVDAGGTPSVATLSAGMELLQNTDLRALASRIDCPVLLLHGARDQICPLSGALWLGQHIPGARLAIHDKAAHAPFLSHPEWFLQQLVHFLNDLDE